uniref:Putative replication factor a protein 3 n=1 Tax=Xenopsylla cheopis TaxID=163159 RepID=A0A6M2DH03_XENCH
MTVKKANGAYMRTCNGMVSLTGLVNNVDSSGRYLNIETTDKINVKVVLNEPLSEALHGWVEIVGQPMGKDTINCSQYVIIQAEKDAEEFDVKAYNYLVHLLNNAHDAFLFEP